VEQILGLEHHRPRYRFSGSGGYFGDKGVRGPRQTALEGAQAGGKIGRIRITRDIDIPKGSIANRTPS
jgi:hypothetical protein